MGVLFREAWKNGRKEFLLILSLNVLMALLGGIGIVMLIPLLHLLDIGAEEGSLLWELAGPLLAALPHGGQAALLLTVYVALVTVKALLNRSLSIRESAFVENTGFRLRERLYGALSRASWEQLSAQKGTDTINLFVSQCNQVSRGVGGIIRLFAAMISAAIQLAIALWMNAAMTASVCAVGAVMVAVFLPMRRKSKEYGDSMIRISREFYSELENQLAGVKEVRAYGVEREHARRFERTSEAFRSAQMRYVRMTSIPYVAYSVAAACIIAGVYLLSVMMMHVSVDRLVVLVYIFARLWPIFSGLQGQIQGIYSCVPAHEKLETEIEAMEADAEPLHSTEGDFSRWKECTFENVSFAYRGAKAEALDRVNLTVRCGEVTALLGRNGSGKTTAVNLLLGFLHPSGGCIRVDGVPLTPQNVGAWRRQVGYVPQEPLILNASVRENLTRFHPDAKEEELEEALKTAMAWDFVQALPEGMETRLGDRGARLSGGERQRVVLARALIGKPRLMILDEATSALDYESENAFRQAIRSMGSSVAVIVIAHRLATVRMAKKAVVLENGRVAEQGEFSDLTRRYGGYLAGMVSEE